MEVFDIKRRIYTTIINPKRILFDHLPKCGGTTINTYLLNKFPEHSVYRTDGKKPSKSVEEFKNLPRQLRWEYKLILGHLTHELIEYVHPDTYCVTVFRHPVDRIISHYFYVRRSAGHYMHEEVITRNISLEDYCLLTTSGELRNWYVSHFTGLETEEIEERPEQSVNLAFKNVTEKYHLIGFLDDIPALMKELIRATELRVPYRNQYRNQTDNTLLINNLSHAARENIEQSNKLDIQLFQQLVSYRNKGVIRNT